ncbi:unnamed protein product [Linum tenue]|uniref:DJ-1/PfpI domain-containing protein n=1 Tax=Linum tenue TaxID=586396 RepID=A0AAV0IG33_9ROSI|nr:unnamed protein product [Linum tenue]
MRILGHVASPSFLSNGTALLFSPSLSLTFTPRYSPLSTVPFRRRSFSIAAEMASPVKKVLVPIANGTEPMEAVITIDVLRRAGADVTVASVGKELRVEAAHGVKIIADALVSSCVDNVFDLIALPVPFFAFLLLLLNLRMDCITDHATIALCVGPNFRRHSRCCKFERLQRAGNHGQETSFRRTAICCSLCLSRSGTWFMGFAEGAKSNPLKLKAIASLLRNIRNYRKCLWISLVLDQATCYPSFMQELQQSSAIAVESRVQKDGITVTSRGPGTTMEFSVALVEQLYGKEKANEVSGPLVMRPNHGDEYTIKELNSIPWTTEDNPPQVLVPIANGSEEMEAVMIIDILRRAKVNVVVASVEEKLEILASRKVKLEADMLLDDAAKLSYHLIVLPGGLGGAQAFSKSEKLVDLLKKQHGSNRPYGAICASPALVLEPHGLLKGKKATAFPAMCEKLSDQSEVENRVVVDGNLITSRGPGTSMEFGLAIVEKIFGRDKAMEIAKAMLFTV